MSSSVALAFELSGSSALVVSHEPDLAGEGPRWEVSTGLTDPETSSSQAAADPRKNQFSALVYTQAKLEDDQAAAEVSPPGQVAAAQQGLWVAREKRQPGAFEVVYPHQGRHPTNLLFAVQQI